MHVLKHGRLCRASCPLQATAGRAFRFLGAAGGATGCRWAAAGFDHHNLAGYFLGLGLDRLAAAPATPAGPAPALLGAALRNVLELHKYPEDAGFHRQLLRRTTIRRLLFLDGDSFPGLPHAARHAEIPLVVLHLEASRPPRDHAVSLVVRPSVDTAHDGPGEPASNDDQMPTSSSSVRSSTCSSRHRRRMVAQTALAVDGLGGADPELLERHGKDALRALWQQLDPTARL